MSDERRQKSWREIDRAKDRSQHRKDDPAYRDQRRGPRREKSYRAALDKLFDSGKIAELVATKAPGTEKSGGGEDNRLKMLAKIRTVVERDPLSQAIDAYLQKFGELPDDMEVLGRALEHREPRIQFDAMVRIEGLLNTERPKRVRAMLGQLRMIRDLGDDPEQVSLAKALINRLE